MNRRKFLGMTAVGMAAGLPRTSFSHPSPNETVNVAIIGLRGNNQGHPTWTGWGRGSEHYGVLSRLPNVRISHVVDVDERHFANNLPGLKERWGGDPTIETDFRRILDNPDVDVITVATPDHWHALMTIWACQAGKDVYVEKPVSHNLFEGRLMVEAARKYQRVVGVGTQRRSSPLVQQAVQFLREGKLGRLYMAKASVYRPRDPIGTTPTSAVPAGVHYDLWLGPAPEHPFTENRFHYSWHWFWDYGTGEMGNNGIHVLDVLRWALDRNEHPKKIESFGGIFEGGAATDQQTPNTQYAMFQYTDDTIVHCDVRNWYTNRPEGGLLIYGSEGWMDIAEREVKVFFGRDREPAHQIGPLAEGEEASGDGSQRLHFQNFMDCVRSRDSKALNATMLEGHLSTSLCHLANISFRLGRSVEFASNSELFIGDEAANALLKREYRAPFVLPEVS